MLKVDILEPGRFWLPLYGQAQVKASFAYASDGEVDWMDEDVIRSSNGEFTVRVRGQLRVQERTYGLMSWPGYNSYPGESLAYQVSEALATALANAQKWGVKHYGLR